MKADMPHSIAALIQQRRYEEALDRLDAVPAGRCDTAVLRLRRQCLGRMGRYSEAAEAGHLVTARGDASPEDHFRLAQILAECSAWEQTLAVALRAWELAPGDHRIVVPIAQSALCDPALMARLPSAFSAAAIPDAAPARKVFVPQNLPLYAPFDADHPGTMEVLRRASPGALAEPRDLRPGWPGMIVDAIRRVQPLAATVEALAPAVRPADAARYLGARLPILLADADGADLDFLTNVPLTVGQRPFLLWYDILPTLFQPFQPFDTTEISPCSPWFWIVRAFLESDHCVSIVTHYALDGNPLNRLFQSPRIAGKLAYVDPSETDDGGYRPRFRQRSGPARRRLLFTTSRTFREDVFYYRGGVDVIAAFLTLADEFPDIELVLRTPLPDTLSQALRNAVERHPRIRWIPDYVPADVFRELVEGADVLLLPAAVHYRNAVVHALKAGVVPVVSDVVGIEELVQHGENGIIVPGRGRLYRIDDAERRTVQTLAPLLQATERPLDPAFQAHYVAALRNVLGQPDAIGRLSAAARTQAASRWGHKSNLKAFAHVLTAARTRANALQTGRRPLHLPKQA